jgi:hypothetical protein
MISVRITSTLVIPSCLGALALLACKADAPPPSTDEPRAIAEPVAPAPPPSQSQGQREWWDKDYGVGVVRYAAMERYEAVDVVRAAPSSSSDTVAVLRRDTLCFQGRECVRSYDRMVEFAYEIPGWAILSVTEDSSWARVTLAPFDSAGPTGWVALGDSVQALLWSRELPEHPLFFLPPDDPAFYDAPEEAARTRRTLARDGNSERLDYIMTPLEVRGEWMRVVLLTPSPMCVFPEPEVTPDTLWIRYLGADGRPRVFYYTRGC